MSHSIKRNVLTSAASILVIFVIISFAVSYLCVNKIGSSYREKAASSALDFAEITINADNARSTHITRLKSDDYDSVQKKLTAYQTKNSDIIKRISLVNFTSSDSRYIYDTNGERLAADYKCDSYVKSVMAELINGRTSFSHVKNGILTSFRPLRTTDDNLCGIIIVETDISYDSKYYYIIAITFSVLLIAGLVFAFTLFLYLNTKIFSPIKMITQVTEYLSGNDSAYKGKDSSVIFDVKNDDEIGRLKTSLQKVFFSIDTGAETLNQAIYDANHDGMTQHLNKRSYNSMVETFKKAQQLCILYFDVNNLKLMNDTLGHESGDFVIKRAGDYIRTLLTEGDFCFRMGGDEFLIIMPECSFRRLDKIMDKLNNDSPYILSRKSDSVKCSLSYGCAYANGTFSYDSLLAKAEENMYVKKAELKELLQMPER